MTEDEKRLRAQVAAHESWAKTADRTARTANARRALMERFEREVDPDGTLTPEERSRRAESARKAHFARLALKSARARRKARELALTAEADAADAELAELGGAF